MPTDPTMTGQSPAAKPDGRCPLCGAIGKALNLDTVKRLLFLDSEILQGEVYLFCPTKRCIVIYFSDDGTFYLTKAELS